MKKKTIIRCAILTIIAYVLFSFGVWTLNPLSWGEAGRTGSAVAVGVIWFAGIMIEVIDEDTDSL